MSEMTTEATEVHVKDLGADGYKLSVFLKEGHYSRKDLKILLEAMRRAKRRIAVYPDRYLRPPPAEAVPRRRTLTELYAESLKGSK